MSEEDVLFDFLKSIQAFDAIVENEVRRLKYGRSIETLYHKMPGLIVKPSYLNAALDTIKAKHGTYDAYFEAEYGLTMIKSRHFMTVSQKHVKRHLRMSFLI
ncbi:tyrosine-protein phosphatase [Erysipelothrix sp. D19-032]